MISRSDFIVCTLSISCLVFGLYRWHVETHTSPVTISKIVSRFSSNPTSKAEQTVVPTGDEVPVTTTTATSSAPIRPVVKPEQDRLEVTTTTYKSESTQYVQDQSTQSQQAENKAGENNFRPSGSKTTVIVLSARSGEPPTDPVPATAATVAAATANIKSEAGIVTEARTSNKTGISSEAGNFQLQPEVIQSSGVVARRIHRVSRGETLSLIARRVSTTVAELKRINGLESDRILVDQELLY